MRSLQAPGLALLLSAALVGCEEANHDAADAPNTTADPPVVVDPVGGTPVPNEPVPNEPESTDVDIDIDRGADDIGERAEQREERRRPILDALDDVDVNVDGEGTDVRVGDGEVDVDTE